ncbi:MAG: transcription antitermination factor NusB [Gammaproteobacteria bacterium]|nr:transcription antitermination factor NusB [Gammaproteobacteria bacterium]
MSKDGKKRTSVSARVRARRSVVQALYQWNMSGNDMRTVIREFELDRTELNRADIDYFREILKGIEVQKDDIEAELQELLDRPFAELDTVEKSILCLGVYELKNQLEIPWRVVLNEAIELAKMFGAEQSHKYVNGILDKAARRIRAVELANKAS